MIPAAERSTETLGRSADAQDLLDRAAALTPVLRSNAEQTERDRRVAEENVSALRAAGLFRLTTPGEYGGYRLRMVELLPIIAEVGRGCASTGWIVANDAASTSFVEDLSEAARRDMFEDNPDAIVLSTLNIQGSGAKRVDGGFVLSGRFPWSSGCEIADWAYLGIVPVFGDSAEPTEVVSAVIPIAELTVERTWESAGMAGTGTHTLVAAEVFVPDHRTVVHDITPEAVPGDDDRTANIVAGSAQSLASVVGAAQGALEIVGAELAERRPIGFVTHSCAAEAPAVQLWFAEATHLIETATLHMNHAARALDEIGHNVPVPWVERARIRMHLTSAHERAREGVERLLDIAGGRGFALANPLQRYWRDIAVAGRHNSLNAPMVVEDYGRALLGIRPSVNLIH